MINIDNRFSQNAIQPGTIHNRTAATDERVAVSGKQAAAGISISSLSQQLNAAQARADVRDSSLDRDALAAKANSVIDQFFGSSYQQNKAKYDAEVPNTNDPAHLERAKQATAFANGQGSNPFEGLPRDQLTLIAYDESGTFTVNERRAALLEQRAQTFAWKAQIADEMIRQWHEKHGDISDALKSIMDYFDNLPPIEEAQYDSSWRQNLQNNILHFSGGHAKSDKNDNSIMDLMALISKKDND